MLKICIKCRESKELNLFIVNKHSKDGRHSMCKQCFKIYNKQRYEVKKAQINEQALNYYRQNKDKRKEYKIKNKEIIKNKARIYVQKNMDYFIFKCANRRALKRNATPSWMTKDQLQSIRKLYKDAKNKEIQTGFKWHVDHIIPLSKGGSNTPSNMRIRSKSANSSFPRNSDKSMKRNVTNKK